MSIPAKDWNNRLKDFFSNVAGMIPPVEGIPIGGIIKFLISIFWPTSYEDIWTLLIKEIETLVKEIVDAEILKNEIAERQSELKGIKLAIAQYMEAKDHEKGSFMSALLVQCDTLFAELDGSLNDISLLPFGITHACQHLALLKERFYFGKQMYEEDNTPIWKKELENYVKKYQEYFSTKKDKWDKWRKDQIKTNYYTKRPGPIAHKDSYCDIKDQLTNETAQYTAASYDYPKRILEPGVDMVTQRMFNEKNAAMVSLVYLKSFYLGRFIAGREKHPPQPEGKLAFLELGPYSVASSSGGHNFKDFSTFEGSMSASAPGTITQIDVRCFNSIDGTQVHYKDHTGPFVGNPQGGAPHTFPIAEKAHINYVYMGFTSGLLVEVQYKSSDGKDSGKLGNVAGVFHPEKKVYLETSKLFDDEYVLQDIRMQPGAGPSSTTGVANVLLTFKYYSLIK